MLIKRLAAAAALCTLLLLAPSLAEARPAATVALTTIAASSADRLSAGHPALANAVLPTDLRGFAGIAGQPAAALATPAQSDALGADPVDTGDMDASGNDLGKTLIALAMKLRDVRYVRGGHDPSTGFDCSGFVRYVFAHAIGLELPGNSTAQFLAGLKVKRGDMQPGDLVFFHTHGRKHVSHVGIYIDNGRFIHSPSAGKSVEVSSLNEAYWAKRFVGARRPEGIAQNG
jgi:cell wall-associated NlpC family hydrolase